MNTTLTPIKQVIILGCALLGMTQAVQTRVALSRHSGANTGRMRCFLAVRSLTGFLVAVLLASCGGSGNPEKVIDSIKMIIGSAVPPNGTVTYPYPNSPEKPGQSNFVFTVTSGGSPPFTWSHTAGTVPPGLALASDGSLTGTPTTAGSFPFTVTVTDSAPKPATSSGAFTVVIDDNPPIINRASPPTGTVGVDYPAIQFTASDGLAPFIWSESGTLPGLVFSLDGVLSGTPTIAGRFPITVEVKDALNRSASGAPIVVRVSAPRPAATFTATGSMATPRTGHAATLLLDGKVLVAGGPNESAELYDPAAGLFTPTGNMAAARNGHTATLLKSGKVLIAGGGAPTTELYEPAMGTFSPTGDPLVARNGQTATLLQDGRVLIAGGGTATAELYDPSTGTFLETGGMTDIRAYHLATLLLDGRVLMIGGGPATAETYDPMAGVFTVTTGDLAVANPRTASRMIDGRVLITGISAAAQLFDPATGLFESVGDTIHAAIAPTASLLKDGTVLLAGGQNLRCVRRFFSPITDCFATSEVFAELFAPESEGFTATGSLTTRRDGHTATVLSDGSVLVVGGNARGWRRQGDRAVRTGTVLSSAELYK